MITFKQYLSEADPRAWDVDDSLEDFFNDHCHRYMTALDADLNTALYDMPLYRGVTIKGEDEKVKLLINGDVRTCYIKKVRKDRRPVDTHPQISAVLDDIFKEKFGWKARSEGLFCKGNYHGLTEFGHVYKVYPMGLFSFLYSPKVPDLTESIQHLFTTYQFPKKWSAQEYTDEELEKAKEILTEFIERKEYTDHDLPSAFVDSTKAPEIMIDCDKYLVVPVK